MQHLIDIAISDLLALADTTQPPEHFLLLPYGVVEYTKGDKRGSITVDEAFADAVIADHARRGKDIVLDYEHQTLSGGEAPAAGWIESLEKTAEGIVAHVKAWTDRARGYLASREYRYHSPVIYSPDGRPGIHSVALTNHPALHGLPALVCDDSVDDKSPIIETRTKLETPKMEDELQQVAKKIGVEVLVLGDGAMNVRETLNSIMSKVDEMMSSLYNLRNFLVLHDAPDLDAVTGLIKGMVPAAELTALNDRLSGIEAEKAVGNAFQARKLVEAQREWALGYAKANLEAFNDFVEKAPVIAPAPADTVGVVTTETKTPAQTLVLSDAEVSVFRRQGLSDSQIEDIRKERSASK